jgi:hypothetical protein
MAAAREDRHGHRDATAILAAKLCQFVPGMMHSIFEESPQVEFHSQLLNDYVTIDEHGLTLLEELDREPELKLR